MDNTKINAAPPVFASEARQSGGDNDGHAQTTRATAKRSRCCGVNMAGNKLFRIISETQRHAGRAGFLTGKPAQTKKTLFFTKSLNIP